MARAHRQAAVIPYRIRKRHVEVALVTTSKGKRWIVPKGSVDAGERPRDAAIREAKEEAGLTGVVARKPVGRYLHVRENGRFRVDVYLMCVTRTMNHWLEDRRRERRWMRLSDAADRLREEIRPFVERLEQPGYAARVGRSRHGH
jgi:phosphohistidine phosphatase